MSERQLKFAKIAALVSSFLLIGAYICYRATGTISSMVPAGEAPAPQFEPAGLSLPGSKSAPVFTPSAPAPEPMEPSHLMSGSKSERVILPDEFRAAPASLENDGSKR